ncbi:heavy metal translocating P-type ATPase [Piscinibacter gummiphilus]|uniref:P-type Zn(2+) transporter n=1 Tax=Piscinibacter gummiphilus TaxID=946333 RepID=A0ABZ0D154_9BURK|nr:heavy metal translocating P-type ATPase [Piscinibacter gummiphilus]WOB10936.1 heavy metal translocating P-type ATPase [Piscinibacter gummiphilus]
MSNPQRLNLELSIVLPSVADERDGCVQRLTKALEEQPGVDKAHIKTDGDHPQLCIHFDPDQVPLRKVRELAFATGAQLTERYGHLVARQEPTHARAARRLTEQLRAIPGVLEADASASGVARIEYDRQVLPDNQLLGRLKALDLRVDDATKPASPATDATAHQHADEAGAEAHKHEHEHNHGQGHTSKQGHQDHDHSHGGIFGANSELIFSLLSGGFLLVGWLLWRAQVISNPVALGFFFAAYIFGGYYTFREAVENLRARRFEIDTLMLVAAFGAACLGEWEEGALLLFLFSLGHSLERYAMGRAKRAIEALAKLAPERALVRRDGQVVEVDVGALNLGDVVLVKPNERLPADGIVVLGTSSVNQAPVTGESVPVDKQPVSDPQAALASFDRLPPEHRVFAGTINGSGALEMMVAKRASESTMARVVRLVTEAQAQRSPTQNFTDKFEKIFVPSILILVALLMGAGLVIDEPFSATFYRAMAVLVAASPCALAISVPSAVLSGVARAARSGVLVKGGAPLENLGTLTAIAFDKTGTLTEGKPRLTDVVPARGASEAELLSVALAVEHHSDHPLATAIVAGARVKLGGNHPALEVSDVQSVTGRGVQAKLGNDAVHIGKAVLFKEIPGTQLPPEVVVENDRLVSQGRTTMLVRHGYRYLGILGVIDTPRPSAPAVMQSLKALGIERLIMISGDNQRVADAVAQSVGLTEAQGDLMPDDKVEAIKKLRGDTGKVAMVGDGVNDAPAMANATVGIAMGAAGSDVALETADVALMADDLAQLPLAVGLSRATSRVIKQNLWVSLGVVAMLIPATILGLNIGVAVLFHEGSTLLVVINALRLLAFKQRGVEPTTTA